MSEEENFRQQRESTLTVLLAVVCTGLFVTFLIFISNGILLYMLGGAFGILGIGALHYLLWGFDLSRKTEGEREVEDEDESELRPWESHSR